MALALTVRDLARGRTPKILEIGTLALFGVLAACALLGDPGWSIPAVRLELPPRYGIIVTVLAIIGAVTFTQTYPEWAAAPADRTG